VVWRERRKVLHVLLKTFAKGVDTFQAFLHNLVSPMQAALNTGGQ
jgi:hypothetical protein